MNLKLKIAALATLLTVAALTTAVAPASATVLCKVASASSCGLANHYGPGTKIESHLAAGTRAIVQNASGEELAECRESTLDFVTTSTGGATQTVTLNTEAFSFASCTALTPVILKKPTIELHWNTGSNNATITESGLEITVLYFGSLDCVYGAAGAQTVGPLTGGKPAKINMDIILGRIKGIGCPEIMKWLGTYEVTAPNPLYVTAS